MSEAHLVEITDAGKGIQLVRLQSPPVNAWTDEFIAAVEEALLPLEQTRARAVVVTGFGRYFSAGGDFERFQHITDVQSARSFVVQVQGLMDRIAAIPVPVVAAINGAALGGGLELALACDLRVAGASVTLGLPESRWGILAGAGGTQRLARLVGPGAAKRMMYTAKPVGAAEAFRIGLVDQVSENDDPLDDALELAAQIAANSPRAIRSIKRCVDEGLNQSLDEGLRVERELWIDLIPDGDLQEGAAAFFERRPPRYGDWPRTEK